MMKRKFVAALVAVGVALAVGPVVSAKTDAGKSNYKRAYQFHGTVSSVTVDDDATTADSIVVSVTKANGNGKSLVGTDVTVSVSDATRYYGAASSASDVAAGDAVKIKARNSETGFVGQTVKEKGASDEADSD
ncbi:MAG: hypothetical protein WD826_08240 [Actinomycetota bacterium]